jgi:hypothetical protein
MSSMLEQAIIDANILKESAEKQAEKTILDKYSSEVKNMYEEMLETEAPDPLFSMAGEQSAERGSLDLDFDDDLEMESDSMDSQIPMSYTDGEEMLGAPAEEEEIEIDFDKLSAMLNGDSPEGSAPDVGEPIDMGLAGDEDQADLGDPNDLSGLDMSNVNEHAITSKAMGNAPEDTMKNISPNVTDRSVKTKASDPTAAAKERGFEDILADFEDENGPIGEGAAEGDGVCGKCNSVHGVAEMCTAPMKEVGDEEPKERVAGDDEVDYTLQKRLEKAREAYSEYDKASKAATRFPGNYPNGESPVIVMFKRKAEEARKEVIRLTNIISARSKVASGGDPEGDYQANPKVPRPRTAGPDYKKDLEEKIIMDDEGNKSGWTGRSTDILAHELDKNIAHDKFDKTPSEEFKDGDYKKDLEDKDTEYDSLKEEYNNLKNYFKKIYKENLTLKESNSNYSLKIGELSDKNSNFLTLLERAQKELEGNDLSVMKLFYENKVYRNASLNERQKSRIVEAISEINTTEQIKPVYEALLNTKGTISKKKESSNPLSEAMRNRPKVARMVVAAKDSDEPKEQPNNVIKERWQKLAGIKK